MSLKKALAILLGLFVTVLVICFLVQAFLPNPLTALVTHFVLVDLIGYITGGIAYIAGAIGAVTTTIGVAMNKVNNTKKQAQTQVSTAQATANEANSNVTTLLTENQQQATKITSLTTENEALKTSTSETTAKYAPLQAENERLKIQLQTLQDQQALATAYANDPRVKEAVTPVIA